MDNARVAFEPAYPAAGARPGPRGIDDSLESALLAGLADSSEPRPRSPASPRPGRIPIPPGRRMDLAVTRARASRRRIRGGRRSTGRPGTA